MHPALQSQLRSAARQVVHNSSKSPRPPIKRKFHQVFGSCAAKPPQDGIEPPPNVSTPTASTRLELEKCKADLEESKVRFERSKAKFQHLIDKEIDIARSVETQTDVSDRLPHGNELKDGPARENSTFYGSASRRRQRTLLAREIRNIDQRRAPDWFIEWNVQLAGERSFFEEPVGPNQPIQEHAGPPAPIAPPASAFASQSTASSHEERGERNSREKTTTAYDAQLRELEAISRGLLRVSTPNKDGLVTPRHEGPHIVLDHQDMEVNISLYFWRDIVESLASELNSDLVVLNAQDIGEIIATAKLGDDITSQALLLNYEIADKIKRLHLDPSSSPLGHLPRQLMGDEHLDEHDDLEEMPLDIRNLGLGTPLMIGKPIAIDITKILNTRPGKHGSAGSQGASSMLSALFNTKQSELKKQGSDHFLGGVVGGILSAPESRRLHNENGLSVEIDAKSAALEDAGITKSKNPETKKVDPSSGDSDVPYFQPSSVASSVAKCPTKLIIYIEALDLLQDHSLGQQFLSELYEQVHERRLSGQEVIIIGAPPFQNGVRAEWVDGVDIRNATRRVELIPPDPPSKNAAKLRKMSIQQNTAMNYRNLQMMVRTKRITEPWPSYDPRSISFLDDVFKAASMPQTSSVWNLQYVQRLAAVLWGTAESEGPAKPSISNAITLLEQSDRAKNEWLRRMSRDQLQVQEPLENSRMSMIRSTATKHEKALLAGVIEPSKISVTFQDVHAPFETIEAIQTLTTLSLIRPEAFRYGVLASDRLPGLLLYGPPGTGKTLLAKAVAKESGATVLSISSAQLNDMYVGEGEKNVAALFSLAKKLTPCVIFLDEADAIFSARSNRGHRVNHRELLNQFLAEWDGMSNDASGAFIMVATNRPLDLDDAVLRRLPRRLLIDLPTESDRLSILKIHLREEVLDTNVDLVDLARRTPFYSGSDLKNLAVAAALECVRQENEAAKTHRDERPFKYAEKRTLTFKHFEKALHEISASISEDMASLRDIKKFDDQYGDKRGKKQRAARWGFSSKAEVEKVLDTVKVRA